MIPKEEYLVHITTGTHVAQICWFLLTEARYLPASLLQTSPAPKGASDETVAAGIYSVIDLDLSRYATLTSRFQREQQQSVSFLKAGIETRNATFNALIDRIERVAIRSTDRSCLPAQRAPVNPSSPNVFSASSVAASGGGKILGGELRHAARR